MLTNNWVFYICKEISCFYNFIVLSRVIEIGKNGFSCNNSIFLLVGYSEDRNSMWREMCLTSRAQLTHPYLRATFAFLTADGDSYDNVLVSLTLHVSVYITILKRIIIHFVTEIIAQIILFILLIND